MADKFITVKEAAEKSKLSESFIRHLCRINRIKFQRVGQRLLLVKLQDLLDQSYVRDEARRNVRRGNK